jgi:Tfp pilus assembly major pilin PilA
MRTRLRSTWLAGGSALLLIASVTGLASAAPLVGDAASANWVDANGNGVADSCETAVVADEAAMTSAMQAADLDGDGTISTSEAAQTTWIGGPNCNHGGYVSSVAETSTDTCDEAAGDGGTTDGSAEESQSGPADGTNEDSGDQGADATTTTPACDPSADAGAPSPVDCPAVAPLAPADGVPPIVDTAPNAHGTAVSAIAQSTAVGGKNCNHGGAVSEAAKAGHGKPDMTAKRAAQLARQHGKGHGGPN